MTFFDSYELIWTAVRPVRSIKEIEELTTNISTSYIGVRFNYAERRVVRRLLYATLDATSWCELLDGCLSPPPYTLDDLHDVHWTRNEIVALVNALPPSLDVIVSLLPFRLAMRVGVYDARLRASARRLCWILNLPFSLIIETREEQVSQAAMSLLHHVSSPHDLHLLQEEQHMNTNQNNTNVFKKEMEGKETNSQNSKVDSSPSTQSIASHEQEAQREREEEIVEEEEVQGLNNTFDNSDSSKRTTIRNSRKRQILKRVATIGGFAALGGAALVLTGGLAAPLVTSAYTTLLSALTVTAGAIGSAGAFVLGSSAIATLFATIIEATTHAAAIGSLLTPLLSTTSISVLFGAGGATLGGYKAYRRTAEAEECVLRSVHEVEVFSTTTSTSNTNSSNNNNNTKSMNTNSSMYTETESDLAYIATLSAANQAINKNNFYLSLGTDNNDVNNNATMGTKSKLEKEVHAFSGTVWDLSTVVEEESLRGLIVPSHTRAVAMAHVGHMRTLRKRFRHLVFGLESQLNGYVLELKAIKLTAGVWWMAPVSRIEFNQTAICACMNRFARPTGTGFVMCYTATPHVITNHSEGKASLRVWMRVEHDFFTSEQFSALVEPSAMELDPFASEFYLEQHASEESTLRVAQRGLVMEFRRKPFVVLTLKLAEHEAKITNTLSTASQGVSGRKWQVLQFPLEELAQRKVEYSHDVSSRRKVGIALANHSSHDIQLRSIHITKGIGWNNQFYDNNNDTSLRSQSIDIHPQFASLAYYVNKEWTLDGVKVTYMLTLHNTNEHPLYHEYHVMLQAEVNAFNTLRLSIASAPLMTELQQMEVTLATPSTSQYDVETHDGLFFALRVKIHSSSVSTSSINSKNQKDKEGKASNCVELSIYNALERDVDKAIASVEKTTLAIGVCGYAAIFDPRRPTDDQQVGLWQNVFAAHTKLIGHVSEEYAFHWENEELMKFGEMIDVDFDIAERLEKQATSEVKSLVKKSLLQGAIFAGFNAYKSLLGAFQLPLYAVWAANVIDNTFATLSNRATSAGKALAQILRDVRRGNRPVTLIGYSFGCKVIAECLLNLDSTLSASIVENVYLCGAVMPAEREMWQRLRSAVAGRVVNVYTRHDWPLWLLYRTNDAELKPLAGITPINVPGVENVDVSPIIRQHAEYGLKMRDVLNAIPEPPTQESWNPINRMGSPGLIINGDMALTTVQSMTRTLTPRLGSWSFSAFALRNCIYTGSHWHHTNHHHHQKYSSPQQLQLIQQKQQELEEEEEYAVHSVKLQYVSCAIFAGFYEYTPPLAIDAHEAGVFGVMCSEQKHEMAGMFAYRAILPNTIPVKAATTTTTTTTADNTNNTSKGKSESEQHYEEELEESEKIEVADKTASSLNIRDNQNGSEDVIDVNRRSARDLLMMFFYYINEKNELTMTVHVNSVLKRTSAEETSDEAEERIFTIATEAFNSLEDIKELCMTASVNNNNSNNNLHEVYNDVKGSKNTNNSYTSKKSNSSNGNTPLQLFSQSYDVPLEHYYKDKHRNSNFIIRATRSKEGVMIYVLSLLTRHATQLQQQSFTLAKYDKHLSSLHMHYLPQLSIHHHLTHHHITNDITMEENNSNDTFLYDTNTLQNKSVADLKKKGYQELQQPRQGEEIQMPLSSLSSKTHVRVAQVHSFDNMQNFLISHAKRIAQAQKQLQTESTNNDDDKVNNDNQIDSVVVEAVSHTHEHINVVIANCAEVPIFYVEKLPSHSEKNTHFTNNNEEQKLEEEEFQNKLHWESVPPPSIPPRSFALVIASVHDAHECNNLNTKDKNIKSDNNNSSNDNSITMTEICVNNTSTLQKKQNLLEAQYETLNARSAFVISLSLAPNYDSVDSQDSKLIEKERFVQVSASLVKNEKVESNKLNESSNSSNNEEISVSEATMQGNVRFHVVIFNPHQQRPQQLNLHSESPEVKEALRSYGWFVA